MSQLQARMVDLRTELPSGWSLNGLSAPRWDGVNFYRAPTAPSSTLNFPTPQAGFAQFRYQLFSPQEAVTGQVSLNGQVLGNFTFPAGQFVTTEISGYTRVGGNTLTVEYLCRATCQNVPISQYWTQLTLVQPQATREEVGLGVERWTLDPPQSPLTVQGAGPILFDGVNFFRFLEAPQFTLRWPEGTRPLNVAFQVSGSGPFRVTSRVNGRIISQKRGDDRTTVNPTLSLTAYPEAQSVQVQVDCLSETPDCARLYFVRAAVIPPSLAASPTPAALLTAGGLVLLALLLLTWGLRLFPRAARLPG